MANDRKERIAHNESAFRELNERLETSVHRDRPAEDFAGFVCECGNPECDATVRLQLATYEEIRQNDKLFFIVPGHEVPDTEDVIDEGRGYVVVRKHDDVAEAVEESSRRN